MSLTLTQIVDIASTDNEFTMVTPSDDIFYANQLNERLTDVIATIADAVLDKADLVDGTIPASQLPSYVDDVLEYNTRANFPTTGESGKVYVDKSTNKTYRWSGSIYVEISASLALGETSSTAYRGDRGAAAYSHSQNGDVHVTAAQKTAWDAKSDFSGSYNDLSDKPTIPSAYTHPASHPASMITGLADVATSGNYNDLSNRPTIPTIPISLPANGGNADTVDNKHASDFATANHSHSYNDLTNKPTIPSAYTHPASHPASMITGLSDVATSGSYNDLTNKPTIPSAYTHPTYTAKSSGLYKVTVDATGHVSAATPATKADITALGIPGTDTNTTYSAATTSAPGLMSASDKSKLDGIATGANKITVDSALSSSSTNPVQNKVINTALAGKAASSHNHALSAITGLLGLLATEDDGDVKVSWSDQDVVAKIKALGSGMHTAYAKGGTKNNPKTTESWRFLVHKTGSVNYGWVIAFGSSGSIYTGYVDNASWKGWKCLYNATSNDMILWTGNAYMQSVDSTPQVVTPSKKLSQCRTGWMLLWSDYDPGSGSNDSDFCTTFIPKYTPSGGTWGGKAFYCDIPIYVGGDTTDLSTEKRCIKPIYVHDNCLKGSYQNTSGGRNDVVLRAVYEV